MKGIKATPWCVLLGLLMGAPEASATVFEVFVAGEFGGQVMIDGNDGVPRGACGIRWTDPDAWYWGSGGQYGETVMNIANNGIDVPELSYTGPYTGCGDDPYVFVTPASPGGFPPAGAVVLVVQVAPGDYEWLDAHGEVIPGSSIPPDPGPLGLCDEVPEFCELPPTLVSGDMCSIHNWCDGAPRFPTMVALAALSRSYVLDITSFLQAGSRSALEDHLEQPFVGRQPNDLFSELSPPLSSTQEPVHLDYLTVGIGHDLNLGLFHARNCIHAASQLLQQSFWPPHALQDAYAKCELAGDRYAKAHARLRQLEDAEAAAGSPNASTRK